MSANILYDLRIITAACYYDAIALMGEEGVNAKLTAYDLLAVMAAPCTRLDYDHTDKNKMKTLMKEVHFYLKKRPRLTNLTHQALVKNLNSNFIPSLSEEKQRSMLKEFKLIMEFDADGNAIFEDRIYNNYKKNIDSGNYTKIKYTALSGQYGSSGLPDKEVTKTYQVTKDNGVYHVDLDFTVQDWVDILRGVSPKGLNLIHAFYMTEGHKATHSQIECQFGIINDSINGITKWIGDRAKRIMGIEVLDIDGNPKCWPLPFNNGYNNESREFVWELRPEVAEAFEKLKA